jgi:hypothetical protein
VLYSPDFLQPSPSLRTLHSHLGPHPQSHLMKSLMNHRKLVNEIGPCCAYASRTRMLLED